jgi:hypothetical protein
MPSAFLTGTVEKLTQTFPVSIPVQSSSRIPIGIHVGPVQKSSWLCSIIFISNSFHRILSYRLISGMLLSLTFPTGILIGIHEDY